MGALASANSWLPEDDLLLKNSVEKGASLECLAKGAVQFSRKFTLQELRDRWHTLLYDPDVSSKVSASMIEVELSNLSSKLTKFGGYKENKSVPVKRTYESVRSCYYARRTRIRSESWNSMDLSFLMTSSNGEESLAGDCILGDMIPDEFELENSNLDIMHRDFSDPLADGDSARNDIDIANNFSTGLHSSISNDFPTNQDDMHKNISGLVKENFQVPVGGSSFEEVSRPIEFPASNRCETDDSHRKAQFTSARISSGQGNLCTEHEKNHVFNSPIPDCGGSFENFEYPSTSVMPMWNTIDGYSEQALPIDVSIRNNDTHDGVTDPNRDSDIRHPSSSGYDDNTVSKIETEVACDGDASTEHYLAELSVTLLNFTDEEELLFMDVNGKEMIDKSYYDGFSSLLLNSPKDDGQTPAPNTTELEISVISDPYLTDPSGICDEGFTNMKSHASDTLEMHDQLCCTLNTEHPEIPCINDVFLSGNRKVIERGSAYMNKKCSKSDFSHGSSQMVGLKVSPEAGQFCPADIAPCGSNQIIPRNFRMDTSAGKAKEEATVDAERKHINPVQDSDGCKSHCQDGINQELAAAYTSNQVYQMKPEVDIEGTSCQDPMVNHPTMNEEELCIESDDDMPNFSDVEAMVLDMDLVPYDQDLSSNAEVTKYQQEDTKRAIIRLEQGVNAYMQRAIASHGAFAILYGRHSKHYIKKSEVILGRTTDDFIVDIDLGREGCANKISRRQAIIMLDKDGSFSLKNLGRRLISVNEMEVARGQSLKLSSSCLIEIRGIPFIFETNQNRVEQYLASIS